MTFPLFSAGMTEITVLTVSAIQACFKGFLLLFLPFYEVFSSFPRLKLSLLLTLQWVPCCIRTVSAQKVLFNLRFIESQKQAYSQAGIYPGVGGRGSRRVGWAFAICFTVSGRNNTVLTTFNSFEQNPR